jgi:hypothetical protein
MPSLMDYLAGPQRSLLDDQDATLDDYGRPLPSAAPATADAQPIWSLLNRVGTESLRAEPSLSMPRGDIDPVVGQWPTGKPMRQSERDAGIGYSTDLFDQLSAITPGEAVPRMLASARGARLRTPRASLVPPPDSLPGDVAPPPENTPPPGITAYHGSPHSFDAFDTSKIGTGEGAQAYGHGLYFAENEGVAQQYRDQLRWKGANWNDVQTIAQNAIDRFGDRAAAADGLQSGLDSTVRFYRGKVPQSQADANAITQQAIDALRGTGEITGKPPTPGHMYEVNINADPAHFLDWDKPLSEQSQHVQDRLSGRTDWTTPDMTGARFYGGLADRASRDPVAAAQQLHEMGIPGIRYLDANSRGAGQGSSNHVVFDANTIEILRKYGIAGLMAGGGGALSLLRPERD